MSCQLCHYITGHDPSCRYRQEDVAQGQDDLHARLEALEKKVEELTDRVVDYAHLTKLYAESRNYVRTLEGERDDLVEASKRSVAEQDRLDALVERMRPVYEAAKIVRARLPASAIELLDRAFRPAIVDLVDAVERAIAADFDAEFTPCRGTP